MTIVHQRRLNKLRLTGTGSATRLGASAQSPSWVNFPSIFQYAPSTNFSVVSYSAGTPPISYTISTASLLSQAQLSAQGVTFSAGVFTINPGASAAVLSGVKVTASNTVGSADTPAFTIQIIAVVTGPFALQVQHRRVPNRPATFTVGGYGGSPGPGKHWKYNKVGNRWYSVNGDNNLPSVPDPETFWNYEQGTGYNNECIPSVDLTDDDSWCFQIRRHGDLTQSEYQWFRPDDCFSCVRTAPQNGDPVEIFAFWANGTFSFNSIIQNCVNGTETHAPNLVLEIPGSTASTWVQPAPDRSKMFGNEIGAFNPNQSLGNGKGSWRRKAHLNIQEYKTAGTFRAIYDPVRDKFLIPCNGGAIVVYDPVADKDLTPRGSSGVASTWRYDGDDPAMQYFGRFGGFIRNDILYIVDNLGQNLLHFSTGIPSAINNLLALPLSSFFAWVNSGTQGTINVVTQARPNILTKVQRLPDTGLNYTAAYVSIVHDTANDAIILHGSRDTWVRPFVPASGHTIDEWQKFPRLEGWLFEGYSGYTTISGPNQWNPSASSFSLTDGGDKCVGFAGHQFEIVIDNASSWSGTLTLQRANSLTGAWFDVQQFTNATASFIYPEHDGFAIWRIGCKTGNWVSGSIRVSMGFRMPAPSYECCYDASYGGMFHSSCQLDLESISRFNNDFPTLTQPNSKNMYAVTKLSPLPSYIPASGVVKAISTNTLFSIKANPLPGNDGHGVGSIFAYSSGIVAPDYGTHGALVQPAGGGYHYAGTEVYLFDASPSSLAWRMLNAPDPVVIPVGQTAQNGQQGLLQPGWLQNPTLSPNYNGPAGEWQDGSGNLIQPGSTQWYESLDYLPPYAGGAQPYGSLFKLNGGVPFQINAAHSFDLSASSNAGWKRAATTQISGIQDANFYGSHCAWHGGLRRFIALPNRDGSTIGFSYNKVWYLDMENRPSRGVGLQGSFTTTNSYQPQSGSTLIYWPGAEVVVSLGKNAAETDYAIMYYDPYDSTRAPQYLTITGMPALTGYRWGFTFYPEGKCFYAKPGATSTTTDPNAQKIWKITPPPFNWRSRPWTAQEITMGGAASGGSDVVAGGDNTNGFSKNFGYLPKVGCIVWCAGASFPVYAYRP